MRKIISASICFLLFMYTGSIASVKYLEIRGKKLTSNKPPFTFLIPAEFYLIHHYSHENPKDSSLTRVYFFIKEKNKQVEEMLIVQIADKTNPQAGPMTIPPLKPYTEKRMHLKSKIKKGDLEVDYLIQLMGWNPDSPSLQPIIKKDITIPHHWALQGQFQFAYLGEHGVNVRYSKDINSFGLKISQEGKDWERDSISGNEKRIFGTFQKSFMEMVNSIALRNP